MVQRPTQQSAHPTSRRLAAVGTLVSMLAWLVAPQQGALGLIAAAQAEDRPSVAVVGVHGAGTQDEETLLAVSQSIVDGFKIAARFQVLAEDSLRSRFLPARGQLLDGVFLGAAREAFQEGRIHYEGARFEQAVDAFRRAESSLAGGLEFVRDQRLLVDLQLYIGLSYASMGQVDGAREAYAEVVRMAPDRVLDSLEYSPKIVALYEAVRDEVLGRPPATLVVDAPSGAQVFVDGRRIGGGKTTLSTLPPGFHTVLVEQDGLGRWFAELTMEAGSTRTVTPELAVAGLARSGVDPAEGPRSRLVRRLYREIARITGTDLVAMASFDADGNFLLALYSARSDTFSKSLQASIQAAPSARDAFVKQLVERVALYADASGAIKSERVDADTLPMHLGTNPVLTDLLFGTPQRAEPVTAAAAEPNATRQRPQVKPGAVVAVVLGILGAGGAATGIYFAARPQPDPSGTFVIAIP